MKNIAITMSKKAAVLLLGMLMSATVGAQNVTNNDIIQSTGQGTVTLSATADGGAKSEDLLKGYVQQRFDELLPGYTEKQAQRRSAAASLTGKDLKAFNHLKGFIKSVAAGERSSTEFSLMLSEVTDKVRWTAQELGYGSTFPSVPTKEMAREMFAKATFDAQKVMNALLADLPYEYYWFDKTNGWGSQYGYSYDHAHTYLELTSYTLKMNICQEYAVQEGSSYYPFMFNTSLVTGVNTAIGNAQAIVNSGSGSLLNRLIFYKDKICELTSYNHSAADNNWPYGNPWQLVWVFDGDSNTKVVCEGYAKAFKYLCDLSQFQNAECLIATGEMNGGTGAGGHMWNVMKMDDGRNYMVDVTNCDDSSVGYPDKLFMASGPSGSYASGYTFAVPLSYSTKNITYTYDNETKNAFAESALTISATAYNPDVTGINALSVGEDTRAVVSYYTLDGMQVGRPQKGVYVARMADGTTRKVLVK